MKRVQELEKFKTVTDELEIAFKHSDDLSQARAALADSERCHEAAKLLRITDIHFASELTSLSVDMDLPRDWLHKEQEIE